MPNNTEATPKITLQKVTLIIVVLLIAVISFTKVSNWAADPATHTHSITQTNDKIKTVMTLSGGAAGASATLSLLPGDMCTPLSEQLAELATYFLLILSALYLEKFMITLSGYVTFRVLIPIACLIIIAGILLGKKTLYSIAFRIALIGAVIYLIVPASVILSDKIYQTQAEKVDSAITQYNELDLSEDSDQGFLGELTTLTSKTVDKMTSFITSLLESLAVMIVTACIVPILVFVFLVWMVKTIFWSDRNN
ncbi:hypothetical protein [Butyrivibrio sp. VCD2006]|uniref:hypothetical protein n=1 Tax=Butyrivibrio sp. VCD2006 TaxID=1280664 RepID=UPI0004034528|nr:hypothetical protein [Butyrivibrio sp. VCD2006]